MQGKVSFSRRVFPWSFDCRIEVTLATPSEGLGPLCDALMHTWIPAECFRGEIITDMKGRDPRTIIAPHVPVSLLPRRDEIVWVYGRTPTPGEHLADVTPEKLHEPFELAITTQFEGFIGAHHITYRPVIERHGGCADYLDPVRIGQTWPLVIDRLRFGGEYFRSRRTPVFGFAPTVERTVLIEADRERLVVALDLERLSKRTFEAIESDETFRALDLLLAQCTTERLALFVRSQVG